jgi:hypothetical protein
MSARSTVPWQSLQLDVAHLSEPVFGVLYVLGVTDECTRRTKHYFLPRLLGAAVKLKIEALLDYVASRGFAVKRITTDGAKYFIEGEVHGFLRANGIVHEMTAAHTHNQIGIVEHSNLTTFNDARAIMLERGVPPSYLLKAIEIVDYVKDRMPNASNPEYMTPYERETGRKPSVGHLVVPFSVGSMYLESSKRPRKDVGAKGEQCIHLGYCENSKMYVVMLYNDKSIWYSGNVDFDESPYDAPSDFCRNLPGAFFSREGKSMASGTESFQLVSNPLAAPSQPNTLGTLRTLDARPGADVSLELPPGLWNPFAYEAPPFVVAELPPVPTPRRSGLPLREPDSPRPPLGPPSGTSPALDSPAGLPLRPPGLPPQASPRLSLDSPPGLPSPPSLDTPPDLLSASRPPASRPVRQQKARNRFEPEDPKGGARCWAGWATLLAISAVTGFAAFVGAAQSMNIAEVRQQHARTFLDGPDREPTITAMQQEYDQICDRGTFAVELVTASALKAYNLLTLKWVFKEKLKDDGSRDKIKGRLVARGFGQRFGVDYFETFAPTARVETVRLLVAWATANSMLLFSGDVTGAYLNGVLEEAVFCYEPQGFASPPRSDGLVPIWRLLKSLYGLKQAGRIWYQIINGAFLSFGFSRSTADPCLYILRRAGATLVCALYVDNVIAATSHTRLWKEFVVFCRLKFDLVDLGPLRHELGVVFEAGFRGNRRVTFLHQGLYVKALLERFGVSPTSRPQPCEKSLLRLPTERDTPLVEPELSAFRKIGGSLVWLGWWTRIDIVYYTVFLCTYMSSPCQYHLQAAYQILAYLSGTVHFGITYQEGACEPCAFSDADWITAWTKGAESVVASVVFYAGAAAVWTCTKSDDAKLSSVEAEIHATFTAVPNIIMVRQIFEDVHTPLQRPTVLFIDSSGTVSGMKEPVISKKNKQIRAKYWRARQEKERGTLLPTKVNTKRNLANYLTKPVQGSEAVRDRRILMNIVVLHE